MTSYDCMRKSIILFAVIIVVSASICSVLGRDFDNSALGLKKVKVIAPAGLTGDPGDLVTYVFYIQNAGNDSDSYSYGAQANRTTWQIVGTKNGTTADLKAGEISSPIYVVLQVDPNASWADLCRLSFTAWSQSAGFSVNDYNYTLTTANAVSRVSVTAPPEKTAYPSDSVPLTFTLVNSGNLDDMFDISVSTQYGWQSSATPNPVSIKRDQSAPCTVTVAIPAFDPQWTQQDFASNGVFYNTKGLVTLTATSKFMPVKSTASTKVRILPYYKPGLETRWTKAVVEYYQTPGPNVNNKAEYLILISNMNNLPTSDGGTADISITANPPAKWSAQVDPPSPYRIKGRWFTSIILYVTEPPLQESKEYKTTITGTIAPPPGSVSDPVRADKSTLEVWTVVGIKSMVTVKAVKKVWEPLVTSDYVSVNFNVSNSGSGLDTFRLNASTPHGWDAEIKNGTALENPSRITIPRWQEATVTVVVKIPDGVKQGQEENVTLTAVSVNDPNGTGSDTALIRIVTLYRVKISCLRNESPIAPGNTTTFNYTVTNLGSNEETLRISYIPIKATTRWGVSQPTDWMLPTNVSQEGRIIVTSPPDPAWHERYSVVVRVSIMDNASANPIVSSEITVTVEVRMFLLIWPITTDQITTYAMPGENHTYHLNVWNLGDGVDNIDVKLDNLPAGWAGYFESDKTAGQGPNITTPDSLSAYKNSVTDSSFRFRFVLRIPADAGENQEGKINITAKNRIYNPGNRITDSIQINIVLVVLDLAVTSLYMTPSDITDDTKVSIMAEISAGVNDRGVSKDATDVVVTFKITDTGGGYSYIQAVKLPEPIERGKKVLVNVTWTVPKLKWYEREKIYRIVVNAVSPAESTGADMTNNERVWDDIRAAHVTAPIYVSVGLIIIALIILFVFFSIARDISKLQPFWKLMAFVVIAIVYGSMLAAVFLMPLGAASLAVLFVLLLIPVPVFVLFTYSRTKSVVTTILAGVMVPLIFGIVVGAGSGGAGQIASVFGESGGGIPAVYAIYTGAIIALSVVYGIFAKWLWSHAGEEILKVEMKITDIKRIT